ncbi:MAG: 3-isopropylmalate dehydratase small subunit [Actinomycetaceae bacterium]|nr:3-isopropylmalate dehydratase small subunit [Actinomycetaceae bacterium]
MEKFTVYTGIAAPLRRSNVDTDQIIPASFLKRVARTGFDDGLFAAWRKDPNFVLNQDAYKSASILVAGPDFGTGSSREHAVWALHDYGFRAVLSPKFADIFRGNAGKQGLVTGIISQDDCQTLWKMMEAEPGVEITVDLDNRRVMCGAFTCAFDIDDYTRWRLMEGLDDIDLTLRDEEMIKDFEARRPTFKPKTLPAKHLPKRTVISARIPLTITPV